MNMLFLKSSSEQLPRPLLSFESLDETPLDMGDKRLLGFQLFYTPSSSTLELDCPLTVSRVYIALIYPVCRSSV